MYSQYRIQLREVKVKKQKYITLTRRSLFAASVLFASLVHAEVVVVVGAKSTTSSLSKEQASDIFLGKATALTPLDQPESSSLRDDFYSKVTGKTAAQAKSYWAKLSFTGKGTPPKEAQSSTDIKNLVSNNPKLIGYIEKSAVDSSVKILFSAQ
jgi:ABC-type phosphate transport system substrate-binding protein